MAKLKREVVIEASLASTNTSGGILRVWCNNSERYLAEIMEIEGIASAHLNTNDSLSVVTDPRYDQKEIADEIKSLLTSKVPDVFKE